MGLWMLLLLHLHLGNAHWGEGGGLLKLSVVFSVFLHLCIEVCVYWRKRVSVDVSRRINNHSYFY